MLPHPDSNLGPSVIQPVVSAYADCIIPDKWDKCLKKLLFVEASSGNMWQAKFTPSVTSNYLRGLSPRANCTDRPSDRRLSAKLVSTFADRGCHVVSVTDPHAVA
jgi:hypothetical protein